MLCIEQHGPTAPQRPLQVHMQLSSAHYEGMIDTGSTFTLVISDVAQQCVEQGIAEWDAQGEKILLTLIDGTTIKPTGVIQVRTMINGHKILFHAKVIPGVTKFFIVGLDFLHKFEVSIDFGSTRVTSAVFGDLPVITKGVRATTATYDHDSYIREHWPFRDRPDLTEEQIQKLSDLLFEFKEVFSDEPGLCTVHCHKINTGNSQPIVCRPHRQTPEKRRLIEAEVQKLLAKQIIRRSDSPWCAPLVLINGNSGGEGQKKRRLVIDFRKLNAVITQDPVPQATVEDVIEQIGASRYVSSFDMASAYFQIPLDPQTANRTAFMSASAKYEFTRCPFGLSTSQSAFLRTLDIVLPEKETHNIGNYIDDIFVGGDTFEHHLVNLRYLFAHVKAAGMTIKLSKASFAKQHTKILGHDLSQEGMRPFDDNVQAVREFPQPRNVRALRSFLGLCSFYRKFIPNFSTVAEPLNALTRKDARWRWSEEEEQAFARLKGLLTSAPVLATPTPAGEMELATDASNVALGAVLSQLQDGVKRPIAYASRALSRSERNYSVSCREALAVCWAVGKFRMYIEHRHFTILTDHQSLMALKSTADPTGKLARYALFLSGFSFSVKYRAGKYNQAADALSRIGSNGQGDAQYVTDRSEAIAPTHEGGRN